MRIVLVTRRVMPEGGLTLAVFRLARALTDLGHDAQVLYTVGDPPADMAALGRHVPPDQEDAVSPSRLSRTLEGLDPDVVLVGSGRLGDLRAAAAVAPTALHAQMHNGVCADNTRFWSRLGRPCGVRAGWHCALLRPALGCSNLQRTLNPAHISSQGEIREMLASGSLGVVCISTDQAELFARHGVPAERTTVLPNLGIVASAAKLDAVSRTTPERWRDATAFIGRLSKAKGGELLGALSDSLAPGTRFRVFGEGYLAKGLASLPPDVMCGHITQDEVTGVLMWARAAVFPSLWPEPGGIVGIDAQVMGVPLTAFDVGAARYWPAAQRFTRGDVESMAAWLGELSPRLQPRDPEEVAEAQRRYWGRIAERAAEALGGFGSSGRFRNFGDLPAEELIAPAVELIA